MSFRFGIVGRLVVILFASASAALAQGPAPSPLAMPVAAPSPTSEPASTPPTGVGPELSRADLEPFFDGLINSQLGNRNIAGAVVSVVRDGEVLLAKGYGYADFGDEKRVSAEGTVFRPGSISKLFTAIAVMQLVEAGKLDLDRDVREYLDFEIPRRFEEPITLRRILTHTAGFEESLKNLFGPTGGVPMPHRDYLIAHTPAQIYRPGTVPAYSNYAISVAGYIVERITNQPLHQYLATNVFQPLRMTSSTFEQPLPEPLAVRLSKGYTEASKPPKPFEICTAAPAGAMSTTATDMARFMLTVLNGGTLDGATILRPETLAQMQTRQQELHADLRAMGLGFMEYSQNGRTMWGHGGDTILFHSDLFLIPDARIGVYISYNSAGKPGGGRGEVQRAFLERYFPAEEIALKPSADAVARGREVSGQYQGSRRSETNWMKVGALLGQTKVTSDAEGVLTIPAIKNLRGQPKRWREAAPYSYREIDGHDRLAFRRDANGAVTELLPNVPIFTVQRVSGLGSKAALLPIVGGSLAIIALTLVLWPFAAIVRKRYRRTVAPDASSVWLHRLSRVVCLLIVGMLAALAYPMSRLNEDIGFLGDKANPFLHISHVLGWLACAGVLILVATMVRFWRTAGVGWWPRVHSTLLTLAVVVFLLFAWQYHLLSPSLKF